MRTSFVDRCSKPKSPVERYRVYVGDCLEDIQHMCYRGVVEAVQLPDRDPVSSLLWVRLIWLHVAGDSAAGRTVLAGRFSPW
jgi:hypothetical protein